MSNNNNTNAVAMAFDKFDEMQKQQLADNLVRVMQGAQASAQEDWQPPGKGKGKGGGRKQPGRGDARANKACYDHGTTPWWQCWCKQESCAWPEQGWQQQYGGSAAVQPAATAPPAWAQELQSSVASMATQIAEIKEAKPAARAAVNLSDLEMDVDKEKRIAKFVAKEISQQFQPVCELLGEGFKNLHAAIRSNGPEKRRISFGEPLVSGKCGDVHSTSSPTPTRVVGGTEEYAAACADADDDDAAGFPEVPAEPVPAAEPARSSAQPAAKGAATAKAKAKAEAALERRLAAKEKKKAELLAAIEAASKAIDTLDDDENDDDHDDEPESASPKSRSTRSAGKKRARASK
jgi:hypothetical protein